MPLLKFAYSRYCVLIDLDAVFDVTSWRRMLIDTALYVRSDVRSHTSADATPSSGTRVYAGIDNLKGNRLSERDVVSCFVRVQGEDSDSSTPLLSEMDLDTLSAAFHAGGRALTSAAAAILAPYSFVPASGAVPQARQVISFMEWVEALCRVAIIKWDDPTMPLPEKAARAFDALAVRLSSEPGTPWRAGAEVQESTTKTSGGFRR
ncbi:MAG: hypothetical protein EOO41_00395 [Methanobacteriota archaeon]|nr:MAG: hypothetical protein EOO41_00395 [Euryarchaeota archaeon]